MRDITDCLNAIPITTRLVLLMGPIVDAAIESNSTPLCVLTRGMWARYMIEMGESPNAMPCAARGILGAAIMLVEGERDECDGLLVSI